ncbi:SDR family NAD(P)-dependent oxidoreductase [Kitasatospora sp. Ki12]
MAAGGLDYGPVFQGLRAAWRLGEEVYAEIALPEDEDPTPYNLHPALLDAALHAITLTSAASDRGSLPFSWSGLHCHATARVPCVSGSPPAAPARSRSPAADTTADRY